MHIATILPTAHLSETQNDHYHMCLAHLIQRDQKYTDFYQGIGRQADKYLIMDNGVVEGDQRPIEEIVRKALLVHANEIILPDVFENMEETLERSRRALSYVHDNFPLKVMAVPQGRTIEEWLECARHMLSWDIDALGIPKVLCKRNHWLSRLHVLQELGNTIRGLDVHLLGCWKTPLEITCIANAVKSGGIRPVRGVDSAIAFVATKDGRLMSDDDRNQDVHFTFDDVAFDKDLLQRNIEMWKACGEIEDYSSSLFAWEGKQ